MRFRLHNSFAIESKQEENIYCAQLKREHLKNILNVEKLYHQIVFRFDFWIKYPANNLTSSMHIKIVETQPIHIF